MIAIPVILYLDITSSVLGGPACLLGLFLTLQLIAVAVVNIFLGPILKPVEGMRTKPRERAGEQVIRAIRTFFTLRGIRFKHWFAATASLLLVLELVRRPVCSD